MIASRERAAPARWAPSRSYSFEASGDGSYALTRAEAIKAEDPDADIQVGFFEEEDALMEGAAKRIARLQELGVRVNYGRDIRGRYRPGRGDRRMSATEYDLINWRNLMAAKADGSSDTSVESNTALTEAAIQAQTQKLKPGGELEIGASGAPYFKPSTHPHHQGEAYRPSVSGYQDVDVDQIAADSGLKRQAEKDYQDDLPVKKNGGEVEVGVDGTHTKVFRKPVPLPPPRAWAPPPQAAPVPGTTAAAGWPSLSELTAGKKGEKGRRY